MSEHTPESNEDTTSSDHSDAPDEAKPEANEEQVEGREVFVARDDSGVVAVSESEKGADPRVATDAGVNEDEDTGDSVT